MSDQTIDVGAIRPVATDWSSEEARLESRVSPPGLGLDIFGTPAEAPAPAVATVSVVGPQVLIDVSESWRPRASSLAPLREAVSRRQADVLTLLACVGVVVGGLAAMRALDAYGAASWVSLGGAFCVALRTRPQMCAAAHPQVLPVLRSLAVVFACAALLSALGLTSEGALASSAWVVVVAAGAMMTTLVVRRVVRRPLRVVVVGDRAAISRAAMRWSDGSVQVVGGVLAGQEESRLQVIVGVPTIAGLDHAADWAGGRRADMVIVTPGPDVGGPQARHLAWSLERSGIRMALADVASEVAPHRVLPRRLGMTTLVELSPTRRNGPTLVLKGVVDRVLGSLLLLAVIPFLATTMLLIRLDSRGPALFKQVRIGRNGKPFTIYKLRTMHVDAERQLVTLRERNEGAGVLFKMHEDPRVTRVGRVLRRTSMDEVPQLFNVLLGQMSLVGPRPALPCEVEEYDEVERRRLAVKPGMTGLWQVSGRSDLDWETSIALDLEYVDNWRLADDVLIGLRTVGAVVGGRGAF